MNSINQVRKLRLERAWSQEQLAELASLSVRTVQRIENGDKPGLETLSALAAVFDVSVATLSGELQDGEEAAEQRITEVRQQLRQEARFYRSLVTAVVVCALLAVINYVASPHNAWSLWVAIIWGTLLVVRGLRMFVLHGAIEQWRNRRLQRLLRK
ncbi:helix-turn-helix domain-containing protein [Erwinia sp. V71]|uniref:helix-turn-helix domain-containing protein n=1 Tax=Erwinia sp. V71 TaxID=3369424 RepID=UPI003F5FB727